MTRDEFKTILDEIRARATDLPDFCNDEKRGAMILEFCSPMAMHLVAEYVCLDTVQAFDSYCRFEIVPEPAASWMAEIEARELLLPYSSIVAIQVTRNSNSDGPAYYTYRLIASREYGHTEELENQYFYERDGKNVEHVHESTPTLLGRVLRELEELNASQKNSRTEKSSVRCKRRRVKS